VAVGGAEGGLAGGEAGAGDGEVGGVFAGGALAVCAITAGAATLANKIKAMLSGNVRGRITEKNDGKDPSRSRPISSKQKLLSIPPGSA
jgi:hypothetical protein